MHVSRTNTCQGQPVFTIDRTPDWGYAIVSATVKEADGVVWTELVASIVKPTLEQLVACALSYTDSTR